jgi:NADP-dependent 3-hydroxy acid dehydrogenase YdfG
VEEIDIFDDEGDEVPEIKKIKVMDLSRWKDKVALVTGGSAGVGSEICRRLVKEGLIVISCARRKHKIEKIAEECEKLEYPGKLHPYKCDLTREDEIETMFTWITTKHGGVDICINNAGVAIEENLLEISAKHMREMLDVNVIAMVLCTKLAVKSMSERNVTDGHIININSMSGHRLTGKYNMYAASKFAVTALTEAFRRELVEKSRIRVTAISPGVIETEFLTRSYGEAKAKELYRGMPSLDPTDVASCVLYVLSVPETVQIHDIQLRATGTKV